MTRSTCRTIPLIILAAAIAGCAVHEELRANCFDGGAEQTTPATGDPSSSGLGSDGPMMTRASRCDFLALEPNG